MSAAMPARRSRHQQAGRRRLGRSAHGHDRDIDALRRRLIQQHGEPFDARRPADGRCLRPAERLHQPVIAPARQHGALRAQPVGHELEGGVTIIIEPAHQPVVAGPRDPGRVQPPGHALEEGARLGGEEGVDPRRGVGDGPIARILEIEDAQRIALQPGEAVLGQRILMRLEMRDQRLAPGIARLAVAERVELQRHAVRNAQLVEKLVGKGEQLHVRHRLRAAPITSASIWWNWRYAPLCGRS